MKKYIAAIEIEEEWLKIAIAEKKGPQPVLVRLFSQQIKNYSDLEISQKIQEFFKSNPFSRAEILIVHPSYNLTTRILQLPSIDPQELKGMVELQAVKQTPYSRDEITSGFRTISRDESGYSRVMVAISHRDAVGRYTKILSLAGLSCDRTVLGLEGIENWVERMRAAGTISKGEVVSLLVLDAGNAEFLILDGDGLLFSRSLGIGADAISQQKEAMEQELLREVQRSLESGRTDLKGKTIERVYLTGTPAPLKEICAFFSRELNLPCEIIRESQGDEKNSFLALSELALNLPAVQINLMPAEVRMQKTLEERGRDLAFLGTLVLASLFLISGISIQKIYKKNIYLNELKRQYESVREPYLAAERMVAKLKLGQEQASEGKNFLDMLKDIQNVLPANVTMSSLEFNGTEKSVLLRGTADQMSTVFQMLPVLEAVPHLESVKTRNVAKRKIGDKDLAEFEITARLAGPALI